MGDPDPSARVRRQVIGGVQQFPLKMIHEHGDCAIVFGSSEPPRVVFAGQQSALAVTAIAIAIVRWAAKNTDLSGFLAPTEHPIIRDIAEKEIPPIAKPHGALCPSRAGV